AEREYKYAEFDAERFVNELSALKRRVESYRFPGRSHAVDRKVALYWIQRAMELSFSAPAISTRDAGVALGIGNKTVARSLARLTALGLLTSKHTEKDEGRARAARYEVNRSWELNTLTDTLYSNGGVSGYSVSLSNFDY